MSQIFNSKCHNHQCISTGSLSLDIAIGSGGFVRGHINEICGDRYTGKTTLALLSIASTQKQGGVCAYIYSGDFDEQWAETLGVSVDELTLIQSDDSLDAIKAAEALVTHDVMDLIIFDSLSYTATSHKNVEQNDTRLLQADEISAAVRKLKIAVESSECCCLLINRATESEYSDLSICNVAVQPLVKVATLASNEYSTALRESTVCDHAGLDMTDCLCHPVAVKQDRTVNAKFTLNVAVLESPFDIASKYTDVLISSRKGLDQVREVLKLSLKCDLISMESGHYQFHGYAFKGLPELESALNQDEAFFETLKAQLFRYHGFRPEMTDDLLMCF